MAELAENIISEIVDGGLDATDLGVEIRKGKGLFNRRKVVDVFGAVRTQPDHDAVLRVVERHAGDNFDVTDSLAVRPRKK
jgi:hypothetical protein